MALAVDIAAGACGAAVRGVDLSQPISADLAADIRALWLAHHVLAFPDQRLDDDALERFTRAFGPFGVDPFIAPIPGRRHIIAVHRRADETGPIFAEAWHSDWSFQAAPPAGTCLYGKIIPPVGGDTLFANQHRALEAMPDDLRRRLEGKRAIHSARGAYSKQGLYGEFDGERGMDIRSSDEALATHAHPIIRAHPETGRAAIFGCVGYIVGFEDMAPEESMALLVDLYRWQTRDEFHYRHRWRADMLLMWDNRSVIHMATGGYQGHERLLHRTTIGAA
ncbi:MAG: TauD/TfdA family dioxygenase [Parvularculaceae bacterium]|nr:TauD/TfdA family dioxygenase [Parvularculaceae bacterium]